jgi:hypothetical protein
MAPGKYEEEKKMKKKRRRRRRRKRRKQSIKEGSGRQGKTWQGKQCKHHVERNREDEE